MSHFTLVKEAMHCNSTPSPLTAGPDNRGHAIACVWRLLISAAHQQAHKWYRRGRLCGIAAGAWPCGAPAAAAAAVCERPSSPVTGGRPPRQRPAHGHPAARRPHSAARRQQPLPLERMSQSAACLRPHLEPTHECLRGQHQGEPPVCLLLRLAGGLCSHCCRCRACLAFWRPRSAAAGRQQQRASWKAHCGGWLSAAVQNDIECTDWRLADAAHRCAAAPAPAASSSHPLQPRTPHISTEGPSSIRLRCREPPAARALVAQQPQKRAGWALCRQHRRRCITTAAVSFASRSFPVDSETVTAGSKPR